MQQLSTTFQFGKSKDADKEPILGYLEMLATKIDAVSVNAPFLLADPEFLSWRQSIDDLIKKGQGEIEVNNNIVSNLPTVQEVAPPSGFEAFCRNTSDFIDATLGTVVGVVADGIATIAEGVGSGIGNIFGGLLSGSGLVTMLAIGIGGYIIYKMVSSSSSKNKQSESVNGPSTTSNGNS